MEIVKMKGRIENALTCYVLYTMEFLSACLFDGKTEIHVK